MPLSNAGITTGAKPGVVALPTRKADNASVRFQRTVGCHNGFAARGPS